MDCAAVSENIATWLSQSITAAGCQGMVFGLSGGLDSAVVAALGMRAMPKSCLGVILPCHSDPQDVRDAELVAHAFSMPVVTYDLGPVYDLHYANLTDLLGKINGCDGGRDSDGSISSCNACGCDGGISNGNARGCDGGVDGNSAATGQARGKMAQANLKPRLRMTALYYFANMLNYLVVGTSNRSEIAVGYFTKYGDGGSDLLPIGGLVKTQVRELARYLGIPQPIIDKAPTAGLWQGQTDESEMGITYEELDHYILTGEASDHVRSRVDRLNRASQHKLVRPPMPELNLD